MSRALGQVAFSSGSPLRLYHLASGKPAGTFAVCDDVLRGGLAYFRDQLVVVCESGVQLFQGGKPSRQKLPVHVAPITAAHLVGTQLAAGHRDGVLRIYSLIGSPTLEIPVPGPPIDVKSLVLTPDGSRLAVAWTQGSIWWWDPKHPSIFYPIVRHTHESDTLAFSGTGTLLAEEGEPQFTSVWRLGAEQVAARDPASGAPAGGGVASGSRGGAVNNATLEARLRNGSWVKRMLFTRDSRWLVRGGSDGLELIEIAGPRRLALDARGEVEEVAMDEYGSTLAAVDRAGRLTVWTAH